MPAKGILLVGLRGVGKTVLLEKLRRDAEVAGIQTTRIEAPEDRSLPAILAPHIRLVLLRLSKIAAARDKAVRALRALAAFATNLKVKFGDIEVQMDYDPEPGLADNGDLEVDLTALLEEIGQAARTAATAVAFFIDELQYVPESQLAALISALHRCSQDQLPVMVIGAGLPQLRGQFGRAKSYAERQFDFPLIGALDDQDARRAIVQPAVNQGVIITEPAATRIVEKTKGYPYFLQEWGKYTWQVAEKSPIGPHDVEEASDLALAALDASFFRVRFDRLTPTEKKYLRAMADLGPGPHRTGDIADNLRRTAQSLGPIRQGAIRKGMIWSPGYGDNEFTVPLFDEYMKRIMPGQRWRTAES